MVRHIVLGRLKSPADTDFGTIRAALETQVGRSFNTRLVDEHWIADYEP
jgi:hypothetical protein